MEKCHLSGFGLKKKERVILHRHIPEICGRASCDELQIAEEPAREVEQVHPLINRLPPSGDVWNRAPLPIVSDAATVPIARTYEEEIREHAGIVDFPRLSERSVIPV